MKRFAAIAERVKGGKRITREEGAALLSGAGLLGLAELAEEVRYRIHPERRVSFVVDTNPNYTNVCTIDCIFCAFYRRPGDRDAYTHTVDEMIGRFREAATQGVTTVLLQGGVHPDLPLDYYLDLVRRTVQEVPEVHPHFFSTSEIIGMAEVSGLPVAEVLARLWGAGLRTIPGGGAEILSDRVKRKISSRKGTSADWLNVMREAHRIGFKTTATMMYGHLETDDDILEHLDAVRRVQDEHGGFTAFVPWSFKPGNTPLEQIIPRYASPTRYLQMIAFSRIYLDNVPHIQASWFSEGKKAGQMALHFGADDFGGTLMEENVHAAANFVNTTSVDECIRLIQEAGFTAVQRNTLYEVLRVVPVADRAA